MIRLRGVPGEETNCDIGFRPGSVPWEKGGHQGQSAVVTEGTQLALVLDVHTLWAELEWWGEG